MKSLFQKVFQVIPLTGQGRLLWVLTLLLVGVSSFAKKGKFDYSLVFVPEEGGVMFEKITDVPIAWQTTRMVS